MAMTSVQWLKLKKGKLVRSKEISIPYGKHEENIGGKRIEESLQWYLRNPRPRTVSRVHHTKVTFFCSLSLQACNFTSNILLGEEGEEGGRQGRVGGGRSRRETDGLEEEGGREGR